MLAKFKEGFCFGLGFVLAWKILDGLLTFFFHLTKTGGS